jgi:hypothetical protein
MGLGISDDPLEQLGPFRCGHNQNTWPLTEPQTKLQLIPNILGKSEFCKLIDPSAIILRTAKLIGLSTVVQRGALCGHAVGSSGIGC